MKTLEKGQDKIKKICDVLRNEALEPAKQQEETIIKAAEEKAAQIVQEAEQEVKRMREEARLTNEHERTVFLSSLTQASIQTKETLRQDIEHKFFSDILVESLNKKLADPEVIASLIAGIVKAIEKDGLSTELSVIIPKTVSAEEVNRFLVKEAIQKLGKGPIAIGNFGGGVQVKLVDKKITLDITDKALVDYLKGFLRKGYRELVFVK